MIIGIIINYEKRLRKEGNVVGLPSPRFLCRLTALIKLLVAVVCRLTALIKLHVAVHFLQATLSMSLNDRGISD